MSSSSGTPVSGLAGLFNRFSRRHRSLSTQSSQHPSSTTSITVEGQETDSAKSIVSSNISFAGKNPRKRQSSSDSDIDSLGPRPQKRHRGNASIDSVSTPLFDADGKKAGCILPDDTPWPPPLPNRVQVRLPESTLATPSFKYQDADNLEPPVVRAREREAIDFLYRKLEQDAAASGTDAEDASQNEFDEFLLEDFSIHGPASKGNCCEMRPLQHINAKRGNGRFFFDGVLRVGEEKYFVENVPFSELSVGNYGVENHAVDGQIWIRSDHNCNRDLYYRLGKPAICYKRYYTNMLWIADFAKHVVDFLDDRSEMKMSVSIKDFRQQFFTWALSKHADSLAFQAWHKAYGKEDYRVAVSANRDFLYKEACSLLSQRRTMSHQLFHEILFFDVHSPIGPLPFTADSPKRVYVEDASVAPTIVTPYIEHLFDHLPCGLVLHSLELDPKTENLRREIADPMSIELTQRAVDGRGHTPPPPTAAHLDSEYRAAVLESIKPGDTISLERDSDDVSKWATEVAQGEQAADHRWFGLVQSILTDRRGRRRFSIIWYYRPVETICCLAKYPVANELFLSDHCTCMDRDSIEEEAVLGLHAVAFYPDRDEGAEFICRQTYNVSERRFTTFKQSDKVCECRDTAKSAAMEFMEKYRTGDTVLATLSRDDEQLEPFVVEDVDAETSKVQLRQFLRRTALEAPANKKARPNELVYSDVIVTRPYSAVARRCYVRVFLGGEDIPVPYSRGGVGDLFYVTDMLVDGACQALQSHPTNLRQSFAPNAADEKEKLMGMDLFCGAGNFGRGLEEGGAIEMRWANDIIPQAIHTYVANATNPVFPFLGSIDDLQERAIRGHFSDTVPPPGAVDFIAGGSPCPGFSHLTNDKECLPQRKNQSLVAAFASMVDLYRPRYGILENVLGIVQSKQAKREDVFCQLISALVGMGYQVQMLFLDAWSYGGCQIRGRVFLVFAAPGEALPQPPEPTHSTPHWTSKLNVGVLNNREPMRQREFFAAYPFRYRPADETTADLPAIFDAKTEYCIPFPDHVPAATINPDLRARLKLIPQHPGGMNFVTAVQRGLLTPAERALFPEAGHRVSALSKGWTRVLRNRPFATVTGSQSPENSKSSPQLHWDQERPLTVLEARRAQGFPDEEVLLGHVKVQWKGVGNSVPREVSLALGLTFRAATLGMLDGGEDRKARPSIRGGGKGKERARDAPAKDKVVASSTGAYASPLPNARVQDVSGGFSSGIAVAGAYVDAGVGTSRSGAEGRLKMEVRLPRVSDVVPDQGTWDSGWNDMVMLSSDEDEDGL